MTINTSKPGETSPESRLDILLQEYAEFFAKSFPQDRQSTPFLRVKERNIIEFFRENSEFSFRLLDKLKGLLVNNIRFKSEIHSKNFINDIISLIRKIVLILASAERERISSDSKLQLPIEINMIKILVGSYVISHVEGLSRELDCRVELEEKRVKIYKLIRENYNIGIGTILLNELSFALSEANIQFLPDNQRKDFESVNLKFFTTAISMLAKMESEVGSNKGIVKVGDKVRGSVEQISFEKVGDDI